MLCLILPCQNITFAKTLHQRIVSNSKTMLNMLKSIIRNSVTSIFSNIFRILHNFRCTWTKELILSFVIVFCNGGIFLIASSLRFDVYFLRFLHVSNAIKFYAELKTISCFASCNFHIYLNTCIK